MDNRKSRVRNAAYSLLALTTVAVVGCGKEADGVSSNIALIPDAELVVHADLADLRASSMYNTLDKLAEKQQGQQPQQAEKVKKIMEELKDITGLTEEDFQAFTMSMSFKGIDLDAKDFAGAGDKLNAVMAMNVTKDVTLDQLRKAIEAAAEQDGNTSIKINREPYKGVPMLVVEDLNQAKKDQPPLALAMTGKNRVLLAGTVVGTQGALDRAASGSSADAAKMLGLDKQGAPQVGMRFNLNSEMQKRLKEKAAEAQTNEAGGMQVAAAQVMEDLKQVALSLNMAETMNVNLTANLGSEEKARQAKMMLDNSVLSMARMIITAMSGGQPLSLLETLQTAADAAGTVSLSFTLSQADIETLQKVAEQRKAGGGAPGGMMMPGGAPNMPPQPPQGNNE